MGIRQSHEKLLRSLRKRVRFMYLAIVVLFLLMVGYGLSTGEIGSSTRPGALFNDSDLNFINALLGGFALAGVLYTLYLNQTQVEATLGEFRESNYLAHYAELDRLYSDLLTLAVEHPHLRDPDNIRDSTQRSQYNAYAYMAWNFIETVIDRLEAEGAPETGSGQRGMQEARGGLDLEATWSAAILEEYRIHAGWWNSAGNAGKFKSTFRPALERYLREARALRDTASVDDARTAPGRQGALPAL